MTTTKHTPGTWEAGANDLGGWTVCGGPKSSTVVADCFTLADARLIAAAPDLLEALVDVRNNARDDSAEMWQRVENAIAKATEPS